jgi:hypothetical protein
MRMDNFLTFPSFFQKSKMYSMIYQTLLQVNEKNFQQSFKYYQFFNVYFT